MAENLLVGTHKHSTKQYRDNYDQIFGEKQRAMKRVREMEEQRADDLLKYSQILADNPFFYE